MRGSLLLTNNANRSCRDSSNCGANDVGKVQYASTIRIALRSYPETKIVIDTLCTVTNWAEGPLTSAGKAPATATLIGLILS